MLSPRARSLALRLGPPLLVEIGWWTYALLDPSARLGLFAEPTPYDGFYYYMSLTMVLGSLVAGATSEGGGAIAFPVMTLALGVPPHIARDFSFAIQSFGMTCASITILGLGIPIDKSALLWGTTGGTVGLLLGLEFVAPHLPPAYAKILFVSLWIAFAVALFRLNASDWDRCVYSSSKESDDSQKEARKLARVEKEADFEVDASKTIPEEAERRRLSAKTQRALVLSGFGLFGGLTSSIAGSGLDMATFSVLTLLYRVSEKVATPTSVILMAINAVLGMCFRFAGIGGDYAEGEQQTVWNFVAVCIPIVVIGAPIGATISAKVSRHVISGFIYFLDSIQFISAIAIIQPWSKPYPNNIGLSVACVGTLLIGSGFFWLLANAGEAKQEIANKAKGAQRVNSVETGTTGSRSTSERRLSDADANAEAEDNFVDNEAVIGENQV